MGAVVRDARLAALVALNREMTRRQRGPGAHWRLRLVWWLRDRGWYRPIIWLDRLLGPGLWP